MKNIDIAKVISGIVAVVVGILIAVLGIGDVMNMVRLEVLLSISEPTRLILMERKLHLLTHQDMLPSQKCVLVVLR